ncbi:MAG: EamA family transporter [Nitriliruptoraceae bacterium]|nr:EamA family transporter [Nitriliruptoraceae bacterium]
MAGGELARSGRAVWGGAPGLVAGSSFAGFTLASASVLRPAAAPMRAMGLLLAGAGLVLLPVALGLQVARGQAWAWLASTSGLLTVAWIAVAATGLAYALFGRGVVGVSPGVAGTLTLGEPVTAVVLGLGVLGERPSPRELLGAGLILVALLVLLRTRGRRSSHEAAPL